MNYKKIIKNIAKGAMGAGINGGLTGARKLAPAIKQPVNTYKKMRELLPKDGRINSEDSDALKALKKKYPKKEGKKILL